MRRTVFALLVLVVLTQLGAATIHLAGNSTSYAIAPDGTVELSMRPETAENTAIVLSDGESRFRMFAGYWRFRFPSYHEYFKGYREYPTSCPLPGPDWYTVSIAFSQDRLTISANGSVVCRLSGDLIAGMDATEFRPDRLRLRSSSPQEDALFRLDADRPDRLVVAPRFRPLLAAATMNASFTVSELPVAGATNVGHDSPAAISAARWLERHSEGRPVRIPDRRHDAIYAAQYAIEHDRPIAFTGGSPVPDQALDRLRARNSTDHVVLADPDIPAAGVLPAYAGRRGARIELSTATDPDTARQDLIAAVDAITETVPLRQRAGPLYLSLLGAPRFREQDPVRSITGGRERLDGRQYPTDLPYLDVTGDGEPDLAYGRLPRDPTALMNVLQPDDGTDATVLAAYRTEHWTTTVASNGAGMVSGHQAAALLDRQGKQVRLLAENRTPMSALQGASVGLLTTLAGTPDPQSADAFIRGMLEGLSGEQRDPVQGLLWAGPTAKTAIEIQRQTGRIRFQTLLSSVSGVLSAAKMMMDLSTVLKAVLEYRYAPDIPRLRRFARELASSSWYQRSVMIMEALIEHRPALNISATHRALERADTVVYTGPGNGTHWILPNKDGTDLTLPGTGMDDVFNQYNGTNAVRPAGDPGMVYDLSGSVRGPDGIARRMLRSGAGGYLGFSALPTEPFAGQFLAAYLANGLTHGEGFLAAVRSHRGMIGLLNPGNLVQVGPLGDIGEQHHKTRRSLQQYVPPERRKDPAAGIRGSHTVDCEPAACRHRRRYNRTDIRRLTDRFRLANGTAPVWSTAFPVPTGTEITLHPHVVRLESLSLFDHIDHRVTVAPRPQGGARATITGIARADDTRLIGAVVEYTTPPARLRIRHRGGRIMVHGHGVDRYGLMARNRTHSRWLGTAPINTSVPLDGLAPGRWQIEAVAVADDRTIRRQTMIRLGTARPMMTIDLLEPIRLQRPLPDGFGRNLAGPGAVALRPGRYAAALANDTARTIRVRAQLAADPAYQIDRRPIPRLRAGRLQARIGPTNSSATIDDYTLRRTPDQVVEQITGPMTARLTGLPPVRDNDIRQRRRLARTALAQLRALYRGLTGDRTEVRTE